MGNASHLFHCNRSMSQMSEKIISFLFHRDFPTRQPGWWKVEYRLIYGIIDFSFPCLNSIQCGVALNGNSSLATKISGHDIFSIFSLYRNTILSLNQDWCLQDIPRLQTNAVEYLSLFSSLIPNNLPSIDSKACIRQR